MVHKIPVVWIVGSSTVRRLRAHIEERNQDVNLGLRCSVSWLGRDGRRWEELLPYLQEMRYLSCVEPDVIVVHLGANSIGFEGRGRRSLMKRMKYDTQAVIRLFPNALLMFSDILPRRYWRYQRTVSGYSMERTRRWLNGVMRGFLTDLGMSITMHPDITLEHLADDGVNLSAEGNDILLRDIKSSLAKVSKLNVQLAARAAERELTDIRRENALFRQKLTDTQFKLDALEKDPYALDSLARPLPFRAERSPYGPSPLGRPSSETRAFLSPPTLMDGPPPRLSPRVTRGPVEPPGGQGEMERSGGPHSDSGSISPTWERDRRGPPPGPLPGPPGPLGPPGYIFPESGGPMYRRPPPLGHVPPPPPGSVPLGPRGVPPVRPPGPPADMGDGPYRENSFGPGEQDHREQTGPGAPPEGDPKMGGMPPPGPPMGPMDGSFPRRAPYGPPPPDFYPPRGPGGPPMPMWGPPPPGMMFPPRFPPGGPPPPHMAPYGMPMRPPPPDGFPPPSMGPPPPQQQRPSPPHSQSPEEHTPSPQDII